VPPIRGPPVGLTTLAQCVGEETDTVEDAYEPYLLQQGLPIGDLD
jgi:Holliday junction DNA helicase RuvB